jgi:hypothetical protein
MKEYVMLMGFRKKEKTLNFERNLSQCCFIRHKTQWTVLGSHRRTAVRSWRLMARTVAWPSPTSAAVVMVRHVAMVIIVSCEYDNEPWDFLKEMKVAND